MERLVQIAVHRPPVGPDRLQHRRRRRSRRRKQRFNKTDGLVSIQLDQVALADNLPRDLAGMHDHKRGHRAPFNRSRSLEKLLVRRRHSGNESLAFLPFRGRWHARNVCRCGTHREH